MLTIRLTAKEAELLKNILKECPDHKVEIQETHSSGIGATKMVYIPESELVIDITDYESW